MLCSRVLCACVLSLQGHSTAVDCWAMGVIAAEMLAGRQIFDATVDLGQISQIVKLLGPPTVANWPVGIFNIECVPW